MQEADIGDAVDDLLAVQLQQEAQDAVGAGVLRAHVEQDRLAPQGALGNQVLDLIERIGFQVAFKFLGDGAHLLGLW